jgi:hypothetical protein
VNPLLLVFAFADLIVSAQVRLNVVILGQPVSVPVLWLVAAVVKLLLAVLVLFLMRQVIRDGALLLRPRTVTT